MRRFQSLVPLLILLGTCLPGRLAAQGVPLDALLRGARIHYSQGRFERAAQTFEQALTEHGATADGTALAEIHIWLGLSTAQVPKADFNAAAGHFQAALAADPGTVDRLRKNEQWQYWSTTVLVNSARNLYNRASYDSALSSAAAAVQIDPGKSGAYSLVANCFSALGRHDEMLETAREMLDLNPDSPEAYSLIGLYYLQKPDSLWDDEMKQARWDSCGHYYRQSIDIYEKRYAGARTDVGKKLGVAEGDELDKIVGNLIAKSRLLDHRVLQDYIEEDLEAARMLNEIAQLSSRLFYASNNLNVSCSRAGSALLRAASETKGDDSKAFRATAEELFHKALVYDPYDYSAMFNLGIAQYQDQQDSLAEATFRGVIDGTVVPLTALPDDWQQNLLDSITAGTATTGHMQLGGLLLASVDSILMTLDYPSGGFGWFYFPGLRDRNEFTAPTAEDAAGMFLSLQSPSVLENMYLLLGVSGTGLGLGLTEAKQKDEARVVFYRAIESLNTAIALNPDNAEAWQNLIHCYRETDRKQKAAAAYKKYEALSQ